jgi:DNA-binding SARP family transcriptional activator
MRRHPQRQAAAAQQHQQQYRGDRPESARRSEPEVVRLWLLGGFRVSVGSRTIEEREWRLRKAASLIKVLALASGRRLHREQAMELLWPDSEKRAASNNLRRVLHAARKVLDPTIGSRYLASEDGSLVLCPRGKVWVDVEAFEEAAATARRARDPETYRAALDLYAGELLPEDRYEEWAEGHRRRLREIYLSLLLGLALLHEQRAENEFAAEILQRVLSEDLFLEEAHAGLMRLYALSGRKGEALAQYVRLEEALREVGGEPSASSRALREEISSGRFSPKRAEDKGIAPRDLGEVGNHNLPSARTSFVGREQELVELKRALSMTRLLTLNIAPRDEIPPSL